jgi:hypothetical protein
MAFKLSRAGARALILWMFFALVPPGVFADEGMFMPDTIEQLPISKLNQRGLKIPITDIYNAAGASLKDAIVIIDGGTGEFVSPEGLLLTNHHVAFDALVAASTPANDYVARGFTARTRAEELQAPDYTVTITQDLRNVTSEVLGNIPSTLAPEERSRAIQERASALEAAARSRAAQGTRVRVQALNEGLSYYMFTSLVLRDVRMVYAPPNSVGQYGGETDNFEWPRHGADFAFMRAYVGPDGQPADYSPNNVPFKPQKFLSLSMGGVREGDFMMVLGYPARRADIAKAIRHCIARTLNGPFWLTFTPTTYAYLKTWAVIILHTASSSNRTSPITAIRSSSMRARFRRCAAPTSLRKSRPTKRRSRAGLMQTLRAAPGMARFCPVSPKLMKRLSRWANAIW